MVMIYILLGISVLNIVLIIRYINVFHLDFNEAKEIPIILKRKEGTFIVMDENKYIQLIEENFNLHKCLMSCLSKESIEQ